MNITENWTFRNNLLMAFFIGIFCKLVFCKLQNQKTWDDQVISTEISNRGAWPKWLNPPYIYRTHWHNTTKRVLLLSKIPRHKMTPNINRTSQKWHLKKLASQNLTLLVFWSTTNTLLIEPTPTLRHKLKKLNFKVP